jgi:hypothetical protein
VTDLLNALGHVQLWQAALAVIVAVAGSSAASALVSSLFDSRKDSKGFRRTVRKDALDAIGAAYGCYLKYGNAAAPLAIDPSRDQEVAERSASMHVAIAAIGDSKLLPASYELSVLGELFAGQDEATSIVSVDEKFTNLVESIAKQVPK